MTSIFSLFSAADASASDGVHVAASEPALHHPSSPRNASMVAKVSLTIPYSRQFSTKRKIFGRGPDVGTTNRRADDRMLICAVVSVCRNRVRVRT